MFELIITKLSTVQNNIKYVKNSQDRMSVRVSELEQYADVLLQSLDDAEDAINDISDMNLKLVQAAIKSEEQIDSTKKAIQALSSRCNKGAFIVNGLVVPKDKSVQDTVSGFIKDVLKVPFKVKLTSAHRMGNARNAPTWFRISDPDKRTQY